MDKGIKDKIYPYYIFWTF